ncbi:hypothetical protein [Acinetobacter radioresistens]|uniref:hypothetical protein n=1 Tax=Acinetobacter radioresistens TaxID=40216 RepID=UPI0020052EA7|nr:hypothetical protein [Acinetobacter radioresistens]MCK4107736.1 hypothetical protein [Acinetobacter radioresistens]
MKNKYFLKRISKRDLYDLLRLRYPISALGTQSSNIVIFKETIYLLENYDHLLLMLRKDLEPTNIKYHSYTYEQRLELINFIDGLRYPHQILFDSDSLVLLVFSKITQYLGLNSSMTLNPIGVVRELNRYLAQGPLSLCTDRFVSSSTHLGDHEIDTFFALLEKLKPQVQVDTFVQEQFILTQDEEEYEQTFFQVLNEHKQVYVLCLDITIGCNNSKIHNDYRKLYADYENTMNKITQQLTHFGSVIHYLLKLEPSQEFGFNLHFVLLLKEDRYFAEDTYIAKLKNEIDSGFSSLDRLSDRISIRNWNDVIRNSGHKKAVGLIKKNDLMAINESWYWVFSTFFSINQIIKFNFGFDNDVLRWGEPAPIMEQPLVQLDDLRISSKFKFSDLGGQNTKIFDNRKHLSLPSQNYLKIAELIYSESPYLLPDRDDGSWLKSISSWIEIFCETLKTVKPELFIIPKNCSLHDSTSENFLKMLTRLGRMWLVLFQQLNMKSDFLTILSQSMFQSINLCICIKYLRDNFKMLLDLHSQEVTETIIINFNNIFIPLRSTLITNIVAHPMAVLDKRLSKVQKYARYLLSRDLYVLRLKLKFNHSLGKKQQTAFLTELLRVGQSAKPLCWLRGYLQRWDEDGVYDNGTRQMYADLTLFFEDQPKLQDVNILQELEQYLTKFILRYNEKIKLKGSTATVQCSMLSCNVFSPKVELDQKVLKIETINTEIRKSLMKLYLPYFCFLDLFIKLNGIESIKIKRFSKGQEPKSKTSSFKVQDIEE